MCLCSPQLGFPAELTVIELAIGAPASHERRKRFLLTHSYAFAVAFEQNPQNPPACTALLWSLVPGTPTESISTPSSHLVNMHAHDGWQMAGANTGHLNYVRDANIANPALVIPMIIYVPYANQARQNRELSQTSMLPVFFVRPDGGIGIPITSDDMVFRELLNAHVPFGEPRTTTKVIITWPGYASIRSGQIQHSTSSGSGRVSIDVGRAAKLVAGQVRAFMQRAEGRWVHDPNHRVNNFQIQARYRIGSNPGEITVHDVVLLGIIHVSRGAVMPLLQLRDDFVFT